jgi:hypothetical protein
VAEKVEYALSQGLKVCLCVGESLKERECNETAQVVSRQVQAVAGKFQSYFLNQSCNERKTQLQLSPLARKLLYTEIKFGEFHKLAMIFFVLSFWSMKSERTDANRP